MKYIVLILGFISLSVFSGLSQNRSIEFETGNFDEILKKAKAENKIIMMDAYTTWCGPCKWMAKNVFTDDAVADFYNSNFVNAKFDMEKGEGIELAKRYGVRAYPTILYINGDGEKVHVGVGAMQADKFIEVGKKANDPKGNLAYMESQYESKKTDATFLVKYLQVLKDAYMPYDDKLDSYWATQNEEDLTKEANWILMKEFLENADSREFKYLRAQKSDFISKYGEKDVEDKIYGTYMSKLYKALRQAGKDRQVYTNAKEAVKKDNYHRTEELFLNTDLIFYKYVENNPEKYAKIGIELFENYSLEANQLNDIAWTIYETSENKEHLKMGLKMADKALDEQRDPMTLDTKAALLFKLEKYEEALKVEEQALKLAEENGEDTKSYKEMIEKIKAKM
jgi:thiol-disulfide isomerase/thioredoxin